MARFKIIFDGEEQDEVFSTEEEAEEYALYLCSCSRDGAETLHMSNPGDYDYDEDDFGSRILKCRGITTFNNNR